MKNHVKALLALVFMLTTTAASAATQTMSVDEVKKGMKGYGLTVFEGSKVEKFKVEILGVLRNIGPGQNMILAHVDSPVTDRAMILAGMSGSPIYIDGKLLGALAYGWQFSKEPVAGITPIEEMLKIARSGGGSSAGAVASPKFSASEFLTALSKNDIQPLFDKMMAGMAMNMSAGSGGARRLTLPMSVGSFAPETLTRFAPMLDRLGFVAVPVGSTTSSATTTPKSSAAAFAPGDAIGAVLLTGDFNLAATGTVTHVDRDNVYAFGHPFLDMGEIDFPMAQSEIVTVLPSLASSFKFGSTGPIVGALRQDRGAGIMGVIGAQSDMIPIEVTVEGSGVNKVYKMNLARHPQLSPLIMAMAADSVVANSQRAAGERTVVMESEIRIKGFEPILLREGWAGAQARQALPQYLALVSGYLMSNEFKAADVESVKVHLRHDDQLRIAKLVEASIVPSEKKHINAGDTVKVRAVLKPYRGEQFVETFDVRIPDDQAPGAAYLMIGSGSMANAIDFMLVPPDPRTLEQVVGVLHRLRPSTDLTVGLYSSSDGAVTAGVYLPNLPPSMRAVVSGDTSNGLQSQVRYHPTGQQGRSLGYVVDGALKIDIDVQPAI
ncbi:MAG TPA: SpoIVB peptidase S55 domain-containing protein [Thermoanaerobaculia bacterium]|jgi:hypothetical protein